MTTLALLRCLRCGKSFEGKAQPAVTSFCHDCSAWWLARQERRRGLRVVLDAVPSPIPACCAQSLGSTFYAVPTVRFLPSGGIERGYTLEPLACECAPRWVPHDWHKLGHALFSAAGGQS